MDERAEAIQRNFHRVTEEIAQAAQSAGRGPDRVRLVVVTKAQPVEVIRTVVDAGARFLGENYPEETAEKMDALAARSERLPAVEWHMIGHLQSRKAGIVADRFDMLESLDSLALAEKLNRLCAQQPTPRVLPVLLEYNVGGEESKHGWMAQEETRWEGLIPDFESIMGLEHLSVKGLMTMPPWSDNPEDSRPYFLALRRLREFLARRVPGADLGELSMGTSGDYAIAVQEGATIVRVGQAIVGPRPPKAG